MMTGDYDFSFKMVLLGGTGTDKTGLVRTFCRQGIQTSTLRWDSFMSRTIELDSKKIKIQLWDTTGQERFRTIAPLYLRGSHGIVLVYDITNKQSFENIREYKSQIDRAKPREAIVMMVGNKCHLKDHRQVSIEEGKELAEEFGIKFFETSSEKGINVEQAFVTLAQAIKENTEIYQS